MDVDQDFVDQVLRIARRMIADPAVAEEVAQRVVVKYRGMLQDAFITTVVRHAFADHLREQNRQTPLSQLSAPQQARVQQLMDRVSERWAPEPETPPCLAAFEERLRVIYGRRPDQAASNPAHQALVYGFKDHLGYTPEQIVGDLATIPLGNLAECLVSEYAHLSAIPEHRLRSLFAPLLESLAGAAGATGLLDYWDPVRTVQAWVKRVQEEVERPAPAQVFENRDNPNQKIAYGFHQFLGYTPERIVATLGPHRLEQLALRLVEEFAKQHPEGAGRLRRQFSPLIELEGTRELRAYCTPAHTVTHWVQAVDRRIYSARREQEKEGLAMVFASSPPHESIAFVFTFLMKWEPERVARHILEKPIGELVDELEAGYAAEWGSVRGWFAPLRTRLKEVRARSLSGRFETHPDSGTVLDPERQVTEWRSRVLLRVREIIHTQGKAVLFAEDYDLL
jgi:hypothetical protein